jgi:predicted outer membrane repeat protein
MQAALDSSEIVNREWKLWYLNAVQFTYLLERDYQLGDWAKCYSSDTATQILDITKSGDSYTLFLPTPSDSLAHLGYEIQAYIGGEWKVVGFTYTTTFTDPNTYASAPQYRVRAFDRQLNASGYATMTYTAPVQSGVCLLNDTQYDSLAEAVAAASAGDTIYLLKSFKECGVVIDKSLTITLPANATADVVFTRYGAGDLITVNEGVTLTLSGTEKAKLIFDGNNLSQAGTIIRVNGSLTVTGQVTFRNNVNTGAGGAIVANGVVDLTDTTLENNQATEGGAVYTYNRKTYFTRVTFSSNTASGNGGAIYNVGTSVITSGTFTGNTSGSCGGAVCNNSGGVMTITSTAFTSNTAVYGGALYADGATNLNGDTITGNTATKQGGAIYASGSNGARVVTVNGGTLTGNTATVGSLCYLKQGVFKLGRSDEENAMPTLSGRIYKATAATMTVNDALFDASNVTFVSQSMDAGTTLFTLNGFDATQAQIDAIKIDKATAVLDGSTVVLSPTYVTVTIVADGQESQQQMLPGTYTFADTVEGLAEDKYITSWSYNGGSYAVGATVEITGDATITAVVGNKIKITLRDQAQSKVLYLVPNSVYYLPLQSPSGIEVCSWSDGSNTIIPATEVVPKGNEVYVADTFAVCTVVFKDYDGTVLSTSTHYYGGYVGAPTPTREGSPVGTYTFTGWSTPLQSTCRGDAEYTAVYEFTYTDYVVSFLDLDGGVISTKTYHWEDAITVPEDPSREKDAVGTYAFTGWSAPVGLTCQGNAEYTALYDITYTDYVVTFRDFAGAVLSTGTYHWADEITAPVAPERDGGTVGTYTFAGWSTPVASTCQGNAEYTTVYDFVYTDYVVTFRDYDGSVISTDTYHWGDAITAPENPSRANDRSYSYRFTAWSPSVATVCAGSIEYIATYEARSKTVYKVVIPLIVIAVIGLVIALKLFVLDKDKKEEETAAATAGSQAAGAKAATGNGTSGKASGTTAAPKAPEGKVAFAGVAAQTTGAAATAAKVTAEPKPQASTSTAKAAGTAAAAKGASAKTGDGKASPQGETAAKASATKASAPKASTAKASAAGTAAAKAPASKAAAPKATASKAATSKTTGAKTAGAKATDAKATGAKAADAKATGAKAADAKAGAAKSSTAKSSGTKSSGGGSTGGKTTKK